jgi:hypothetical protein
VTSLSALLARLRADLEGAGARWALVGGLAVSARTEPRFTRDVDVAVAVADDAAAESLVRDLLGRGWRAAATVEQEATGRLAAVRLVPAGGSARGLVADALFASSGLERELVAEAEAIEILPGVIAPTARAGHLLALKVLARDDARRPQDRVDAVALIRVAGPADLELARRSLGLVTSRGYHRGKDLLAELDDLLRSAG